MIANVAWQFQRLISSQKCISSLNHYFYILLLVSLQTDLNLIIIVFWINRHGKSFIQKLAQIITDVFKGICLLITITLLILPLLFIVLLVSPEKIDI
jgi:hypothetical protein